MLQSYHRSEDVRAARRSKPISMQACKTEAFVTLCTLPTTPALL